jgi:hypothetical protein
MRTGFNHCLQLAKIASWHNITFVAMGQPANGSSWTSRWIKFYGGVIIDNKEVCDVQQKQLQCAVLNK